MSSRYAAARPKRGGEDFARTHHLDADNPTSSKKPRFDVRNPSNLAPDAPEEDAVLEADVIGTGGTGTKRNAVNIDGYDSDSENEGFDGRAEERKKGDVDLFEKLGDYEGGSKIRRNEGKGKTDEDEDADMFGDLEEENDNENETAPKAGKKGKAVTFLEEDEIEGQVEASKSGGHVSSNFALDPKGKLSTHAMDDQESSEDEEEVALAALEQDVDEEVGAGGLRGAAAPKLEAYNMKSEQEEGRFDSAGNYVRKAADPDARHDMWLEGVSKKEMKRAAEAHEKREAEERRRRIEDDSITLPEILSALIIRLEKGETVLEGLARLGTRQAKSKKIPAWKLKKKKASSGNMEVDSEKTSDDAEQIKIKEAVHAITGAADQLLTRGQTDVYEQEREMLIRQYRRETGEDWVEPTDTENKDDTASTKMWEYRWIDGRDGDAKQGPYDGKTMVAWQDAGYFGEGIEFRQEGETEWSRVVDFV